MAKAKVETDKVEVFIPRDGLTNETTYFVAVNGVNYVLPRGKKSMVPAHIAEEINRSQAAIEKMYEEKAVLQEQSK